MADDVAGVFRDIGDKPAPLDRSKLGFGDRLKYSLDPDEAVRKDMERRRTQKPARGMFGWGGLTD